MGARGRVGVLLVAGAVALAGTVTVPATVATAAPAGSTASASPAAPTAPGPTWSEIERRLVRAGRNPRLPDVTSPAPSDALVGSATRSVRVTPNTDLVGGQIVTVAGQGFTGVPVLVVAQCRAGSDGPADCDLGTVGILSPDGAGAFSVPFAVRRTITTSAGPLSCVVAPKTCEIVATDAAVETIDAHARISFDPDAPAPEPRVTVSPSTNLRDGDTLTVIGRRFPPNEPMLVDLCGPAMVCGLTIDQPVMTDASGRFTTSITARLRTLDAQLEPTDCLAVTCSVFAQSLFQPDYVATAPVTFDPTQPRPPIPSITVRPATGLHHLDSVEVTGTGFDPGAYIAVDQCGPASFSCDLGGLSVGPATVDGSGNFTVTMSVARLVAAGSIFDGAGIQGSAVGTPGPTDDCALVVCTIEVEQFAQNDPLAPGASAPLAFDASVPRPDMPVVRVKPTTRLPYRYMLQVEGSGFAPGEAVLTEYCADSTDSGMCSTTRAGVAAADGTLTGSVAVQRRVTFDGSTVDCVDPDSVCTIEVMGEHSYEDWTVPISFAPNAPVPPPPTLRVIPARNLRDRQVVAVTGTGFLPGPVPLSECERADDPSFFSRCGGIGQAAADAQGRLSGSFTVARLVGDGFGRPHDCAAYVGRCVLLAGDVESFDPPTKAALAFDPAVPAPEPPTVTLTPRVNLGDGEVVAVHGSGFSPSEPVLLLQCRTDASSIADCDLSQFAPVMADADGELTSDFMVRAHPQFFFGSTDCTAARRRCMVLAVGLSDPAQAAKVPISFLVPDLEVRSTRLTEGTGGVTPAPVTVALSEPAPVPITVDWDAERDTATRADYGPTRGTVIIPAGATEVAIPLEVTGDALDEAQERFSVRIVRAPGTHVVVDRAAVMIDDDDDRPHVRVGDFHATEGERFAVTLVGLVTPSGRTVTVDWHTHHDSARTGSDFEWTEGTVTFQPGQQWALVTVPLVDDAHPESTEQFVVVLENPVRAVVDRALGAIVVTDDD